MNKCNRITLLKATLCLLFILIFIRSASNITPLNAQTNLEHPRLFLSASDLPTLRSRAATTHQEIWNPIKEFAEEEFASSPPIESPEGGETAYRNYGNSLVAFAFACLIQDEAAYCNLAKSYLLAYAQWEYWDSVTHSPNKRDLAHAHLLVGTTLAYDWIYPHLSNSERETVRIALGQRAQEMYEASSGPKVSEWNNWWRKSYLQNHFTTNHAALGLAGLALLGEDSRAQTWIDQAESKFRVQHDILNGIGDGSWHEGINYQNYMLVSYLPFAINMRRLQNVDLLPHQYLQNYPAWRIYNHIFGEAEFILAYGNFEWSSGNSYRPQNVLRFIAAEYNDSYAEWMAQQLIADDGRSSNVWKAPWYVYEFLYYDATVSPTPPTNLAKARHFPDLEGVIWRTGWESNDLIFGLKSGAYGGRFAYGTFTQEQEPWASTCSSGDCELNHGHNHDDTNSFFIHNMGQWLAPETNGVGNSKTSLQNSILIDGEGQYRPDNDNDVSQFLNSDGFLKATADTTNFNYVASDATRRYRQIGGIEEITRHVLFVRPHYFIMVDSIEADAPHQYKWVSHFERMPTIDGQWINGHSDNNQTLGVKTLAPANVETKISNDGEPYVHVWPQTEVADTRLIHLLYPTNQTNWDQKPEATLVSDDGRTVVMQVNAQDGSELQDTILLGYDAVGSFGTAGGYPFNGQVIVISQLASGQLRKLFSYGGTDIIDPANSRNLVTGLQASDSFEAVYEGQTVTVTNPSLAPITLYAPDAQTLIINGVPRSFSRLGDYITTLEVEVKPVYLPVVMK